jgi:MFS family permease
MRPGINLSVYYSTVIFSQIGLSAFLSQLLAAVMNTGFALGTVPLPWTIEWLGRRRVMIWSAVLLTACMVVFVAMIGLPNPTLATQWISVAAIIIYNFTFGFGWIGVPWLYGPEVCCFCSVVFKEVVKTRN